MDSANAYRTSRFYAPSDSKTKELEVSFSINASTRAYRPRVAHTAAEQLWVLAALYDLTLIA